MAVIRQLIDDHNEDMYPVTKAEAVYLNENRTLEEFVEQVSDQNYVSKWTEGKMVKELPSGAKETIEFFTDGTVKSTLADDSGEVVQVKSIRWNEDGGITVKVEEGV